MRRCRAWVVIVSILLSACEDKQSQSFGSWLGESEQQYQAVSKGHPITFPVDHMAHDRFRHEWWYLTANLLDEQGAVLADVSITLHGHAEYSTVTTDDQGIFSIPVEGGGTLTVVYQKQGFLAAQRKVYVPWNDNAIAETAVLIAEDPLATTLTFDNNPER